MEIPAPVEPDYSIDKWIMFINTDERQRHLAASNPLPQECILALNSVINGKWNSKGSSKGKGGKELGQGSKAGSKGKEKYAKGKGKSKSLDHIKCHTHDHRFLFQWLRKNKLVRFELISTITMMT